MGTRLSGWQGAGHVLEVCLEGCYVGENVIRVAWSQVVENFSGSVVGVSASMMDAFWYRVREFYFCWWQSSSNLERVKMRLLSICLVPGHWRRICISVPVTSWSQYGHNC